MLAHMLYSNLLSHFARYEVSLGTGILLYLPLFFFALFFIGDDELNFVCWCNVEFNYSL